MEPSISHMQWSHAPVAAACRSSRALHVPARTWGLSQLAVTSEPMMVPVRQPT